MIITYVCRHCSIVDVLHTYYLLPECRNKRPTALTALEPLSIWVAKHRLVVLFLLLSLHAPCVAYISWQRKIIMHSSVEGSLPPLFPLASLSRGQECSSRSTREIFDQTRPKLSDDLIRENIYFPSICRLTKQDHLVGLYKNPAATINRDAIRPIV